MNDNINQAVKKIKASRSLVFLTGAGVSVPSGIPDYRSLSGVYQGIAAPEYLLSRTCLKEEPDKFYAFVKKLYHPSARPNIIHEQIAALEKEKSVTVVSQNIDGLHQAAGSQNIVNFHGSLYHCYCQNCGETVPVAEYLKSDKHFCGGQIRPNIVLYEETLDEQNVSKSIQAIATADTIVVVGTSLKVYPFSGLIQYQAPNAELIVINQEPLYLNYPHLMVTEKAEVVFKKYLIRRIINMLESVRIEIDQINREIVALYERRMACVDEVVRIKAEQGLPIEDSKREAEVLAKMSAYLENEEYASDIETLFGCIFDLSKQHQQAKLQE